MRKVCLTLLETPERTEKAKSHFSEVGLSDVEFFIGINAEVAGLSALHPYNLDRTPEQGDYFMGFKPTGIFLSHYALWMAMQLLNDEHILILEIDAKFPADWKERYEKALQDTPSDFDILFIGSCCCDGRQTTHVKGDIYDVRYPMCNHAYIVAKKAIPHLLATNRDCYAPIDISTFLHSFNKLKVYTVLPRIAEQFDTYIPV